MSTTTQSRRRTSDTRGGSWRTIELLVTILIGVAFGIVYWGWSQAYNGISGLKVFGGPFGGFLGGPWLIAGVVGAYVVRRPGAAVIAEVLAALVEMMLGTEWGATTIVAGLLQGIGVELAFALTGYGVFHVLIGMIGGALAACAETAYEWDAYWASMSTTWKLQYMGSFALGGALIAGIGGWAISRALAATGAVDALPSGREHAERNAV